MGIYHLRAAHYCTFIVQRVYPSGRKSSRPRKGQSTGGILKGSVGVVDSHGMADHEIVCFHCGQQVGDPPRMNLVEGEPCRPCADRLLETLPGIFHTPVETVEEAVAAAEAVLVEDEDDLAEGSEFDAGYEEA